MNGFITTRHIVTHAPIIVGEFGLKVYFRCLVRCFFSTKPATFLECISEH